MSWSDADRDLADVFDRAMHDHPRSRQRAVGPSQLGTECTVAMLHALNGDREVEPPYAGWQATVGTATHDWVRGAFEAENQRLGRKRYVLEQRVTVGKYAGRTVSGTTDCFDLDRRELIDWKTASKSSMRRHRASVGNVHEVQRSAYGLGFDRLGLTPATVVNFYLPRDGNLTDAFAQRAPYDPQPALQAIERAGRLQGELDAAGGDVASVADTYEPCGSAWCPWCRSTRSSSIFA